MTQNSTISAESLISKRLDDLESDVSFLRSDIKRLAESAARYATSADSLATETKAATKGATDAYEILKRSNELQDQHILELRESNRIAREELDTVKKSIVSISNRDASKIAVAVAGLLATLGSVAMMIGLAIAGQVPNIVASKFPLPPGVSATPPPAITQPAQTP